MKSGIKIVILGIICLMFSACGNVVPPGNIVIKLTADGESTIYKSGVYHKWGRDKIYFVDSKLKSFSEPPMQILCADDINMEVHLKFLASFKVDQQSMDVIKSKVPAEEVNDGEITGFKLSLSKFYFLAVQDIVRSTARIIISPYKTGAIRKNREKIQNAISKSVIQQIDALNYPINVSAVLVSNIDYPEAITKKMQQIKEVQLDSQKRAAKAKADLTEARRQVAVSQEKAKVAIIKAKTEADVNKIIGKSLTPLYLANRQLEVMGAIATGPNNTVLIMPYNAITSDVLNTALQPELLKAGLKSSSFK